jgi:hypothetical protein
MKIRNSDFVNEFDASGRSVASDVAHYRIQHDRAISSRKIQ